MADKLMSDITLLEVINKLLSSQDIVVRKFTPQDAGFPVVNLNSMDTEVQSFDSGTERGLQTINLRVVSVNVGRDDKEVSSLQNKIFNALHQKVDDFSREAGSDWVFHSVVCNQVGVHQVYNQDNPGTTATMNVRVLCEYIGI